MRYNGAMRSRRSSLLLALLAIGILVAIGVAGARSSDSSTSTLGLLVGSATPTAPTTVSTTTTSTLATPDSLPLPEPLPEDPRAEAPEEPIGTIAIPKLDLQDELHVGMTLTAIDRGPSHWPGTATPGEMGNAVVAAHRTTHSKPFERLNELEPGDLVHFALHDGHSFTYAVRDVIVVPEAAIGIARQDWAHTATLFACHPPGSAVERIVAKLKLLDDQGEPVDEPHELPPVDVGLRDGDDELTVRGDGPATDPFAALEES